MLKDTMKVQQRANRKVKQAQTLLDWLVTLALPSRVINALRRDLELIMDQREGESGSAVLAGFDRGQFITELYRDDGGRLTDLPNIGPSAITALRAVIPAPASINGESAAPSDAAPETPPPAVADEAVSEAVPATPRRRGRPPRGHAAPEAAATPEPAPESPAPKRRGWPRREEAAPAAAAPATTPEPPVSPEAPKRRGRRRAGEAGAEAPDAAPKPAQSPMRSVAGDNALRVTLRAEQGAAQQAELRVPQRAPAPAEVTLAPAPELPPDPSFVALLKLWRELHPQGQRAVICYMATLLGA